MDNVDREKRRGLLINITGPGKGKTTSALGVAMRALGWGWRVTVIQFIKTPESTGERRFAAASGLPFQIMTMGAGFTFRKNGNRQEDIQCCRNAWLAATDILKNGRVDLLILDELNVALKEKLLDAQTALDGLQSRPAWMHVVVTGRDAPAALIAASDLVSEINSVKHPFDAGISAQPGIDF